MSSSSASGRRLALGPLAVLRLQVGQALFGALAAFHHVADALFEPADFQRGIGQRPLLEVQRVAGGVVRLAHGFQLQLAMAQLGQAGFQRGGGFGAGGLHALFLLRCVAVLQEPQLVQLGQRALILQVAVARGHLGLLLQLLEVAAQLTQDVFHAREVLARVLQAVLGFPAALFVLADASSFFQEEAQLFRARLSMMRLMVPWPMMA